MAKATSGLTEREMRALIVKACHAAAAGGLVAATDGNISGRLGERVLITPSGIAKGDVTAASVLVCDLDGKQLGGRGEISSEVRVHLAAYANRPDVGGVVHAHPPVATAFTFAGREAIFKDPIVPEVLTQIGPIPTVPYFTPASRPLADAYAERVRTCDVVMLSQHGAVTVGGDPWRAYLRMEKLEQFATILKTAAELAGGLDKVRRLTPAQVEDALANYGKAQASRQR